jgi:predicted RNA-binding Zn-ribbon protein involved in translation (DUF1610 family)
MTETLEAVTLKCPSCGSSLDVSSDMERFACGYCGTEQIVLRRGGTVSLKPVEEAISKVQVGTDKTAAELALVRLRGELAEVEGKWQDWESHFAQRRATETGGQATVLLILLAILFGIAALGLFSGNETAAAVWCGVATLALTALVARSVVRSNRTMKRIEAERLTKWQLFSDQMESIRSQIGKHRQVVNV